MSKSEQRYFEMNRAGWDRRAEAHFGSRFYDVDGFLAGRTSLREIELAEMPDVAGRRLLHLQCHFGLDTLSWARMGAVCTGVDISPVAIGKARELAVLAGVEAQFICADVYGYQADAPGAFDTVFTSYGAICWLPDLARWAQVVARNLAVDGTFYMVEFHPIHDLLAGYAYFTRPEPDIEEEGSYTENGADVVAPLATWAHPVSSVINALVGAGIGVECVNEFPYSPYDCFDGLVEREPGRFYLEHRGHDVPMVYSIRGRKVA
ncbi:class I SAM-dependent methyltransferase [Marinihelvus fidelis]|uniref:Class I SAM-dependent methyltransferase n=1 Tax=Marinihelvus fidelis TaxID=2613842 RepID=A0A5N0TBY5_9GAMM|nr:class I SAM-dependent methyltransferase [Marinihelvus fidelis]KAA9132532.1 class I SAM-dependent methyltransferase [Marinihelvus fidelis]